MRRQRSTIPSNPQCARRPPTRAPLVLAVALPQDISARVSQLLNVLQFWKDVEYDALPQSEPQSERGVLAQDGPLGMLKFWRKNETNVQDTTEHLKAAGSAVGKGDLQEAADRLSLLDLNWLLPKRSPPQTNTESTSNDQLITLDHNISAVIAFFAEALTPWDFDRREPSFTLSSSWNDELSHIGGQPEKPGLIKLTSTIKPLYSEWKLTARTKFVNLGRDGTVFGKAGLYLAGSGPPYVGVEADRLLDIPRLAHTKLFANVNYRSSRKPFSAPIVASAGVQHTLVFSNRLDLTFRIGMSTVDPDRPWFIMPMPHSSYF